VSKYRKIPYIATRVIRKCSARPIIDGRGDRGSVLHTNDILSKRFANERKITL
jgi:hypothetical protein